MSISSTAGSLSAASTKKNLALSPPCAAIYQATSNFKMATLISPTEIPQKNIGKVRIHQLQNHPFRICKWYQRKSWEAGPTSPHLAPQQSSWTIKYNLATSQKSRFSDKICLIANKGSDKLKFWVLLDIQLACQGTVGKMHHAFSNLRYSQFLKRSLLHFGTSNEGCIWGGFEISCPSPHSPNTCVFLRSCFTAMCFSAMPCWVSTGVKLMRMEALIDLDQPQEFTKIENQSSSFMHLFGHSPKKTIKISGIRINSPVQFT